VYQKPPGAILSLTCPPKAPRSQFGSTRGIDVRESRPWKASKQQAASGQAVADSSWDASRESQSIAWPRFYLACFSRREPKPDKISEPNRAGISHCTSRVMLRQRLCRGPCNNLFTPDATGGPLRESWAIGDGRPASRPDQRPRGLSARPQRKWLDSIYCWASDRDCGQAPSIQELFRPWGVLTIEHARLVCSRA
jgi:hypothetical protein